MQQCLVFCRRPHPNTTSSWFSKIYNNVPECYYLTEHISASQLSVLPNSVGLHHLFTARHGLRWCLQGQGHPSSPNMAGVRTTWPSSWGRCWSSSKGLWLPLANHCRQSGAQGRTCPLQSCHGISWSGWAPPGAGAGAGLARGYGAVRQGEGRPTPSTAPPAQSQMHSAFLGLQECGVFHRLTGTKETKKTVSS